MKKIICAYCGQGIRNDELECGFCGGRIEDAVVENVPKPEVKTVPRPPRGKFRNRSAVSEWYPAYTTDEHPVNHPLSSRRASDMQPGELGYLPMIATIKRDVGKTGYNWSVDYEQFLYASEPPISEECLVVRRKIGGGYMSQMRKFYDGSF